MIDKTTADVEAVVKEMRDGESRTRDEMREIRDEVTNVREMLPKVNPFYCALLHSLTLD
jgi:peroxin-14